jgi:hypothetical protein
MKVTQKHRSYKNILEHLIGKWTWQGYYSSGIAIALCSLILQVVYCPFFSVLRDILFNADIFSWFVTLWQLIWRSSFFYIFYVTLEEYEIRNLWNVKIIICRSSFNHFNHSNHILSSVQCGIHHKVTIHPGFQGTVPEIPHMLQTNIVLDVSLLVYFPDFLTYSW